MLMRFDRDRYEKLRLEFYSGVEGRRDPASKNRRTSFDPEDLQLLEQLRGRTTFYPLLFSIPATFGLYALTHFGNFGFFKNPLRPEAVQQISVSRRVRQIYFISFAVVTVPLIHGKYFFQYSLAKAAVYKRYQHLVDQHVFLREEMVFESLIKRDEQL